MMEKKAFKVKIIVEDESGSYYEYCLSKKRVTEHFLLTRILWCLKWAEKCLHICTKSMGKRRAFGQFEM
jgi:hypothetical protein